MIMLLFMCTALKSYTIIDEVDFNLNVYTNLCLHRNIITILLDVNNFSTPLENVTNENFAQTHDKIIIQTYRTPYNIMIVESIIIYLLHIIYQDRNDYKQRY